MCLEVVVRRGADEVAEYEAATVVKAVGFWRTFDERSGQTVGQLCVDRCGEGSGEKARGGWVWTD